MSVQTSSSFVDQVASRLGSLCRGLALDVVPVVATFRDLVAPWAAGGTTSWQSEISDDNTPIELSVSLDRDDVALRVLFEPQAEEPTLDAHRAAGLAFHDHLEAKCCADLSRFRRVQDLFLPVRGWRSLVRASG